MNDIRTDKVWTTATRADFLRQHPPQPPRPLSLPSSPRKPCAHHEQRGRPSTPKKQRKTNEDPPAQDNDQISKKNESLIAQETIVPADFAATLLPPHHSGPPTSPSHIRTSLLPDRLELLLDRPQSFFDRFLQFAALLLYAFRDDLLAVTPLITLVHLHDCVPITVAVIVERNAALGLVFRVILV